LLRLLADVKPGKIQIIVYKVDRLTRSLADFAQNVDVFDAHGASFVGDAAVQHHDLNGRLTLNMLSLRPVEREMRRDASVTRSPPQRPRLWMGARFRLAMTVEEPHAGCERVEADGLDDFPAYAELGSVALLKAELDEKAS